MRLALLCSSAACLALAVSWTGCAPRAAQPAPAAGTPSTSTLATGTPAASRLDPQQRLAELGRCPLESGAVIADCRLGYRTFGSLNAARSNAVLVPTWFTGTSADLAALWPDRFVDTTRFYLILVDAFGDGISSSPSNSRTQPRLRFPRFSIRDLVESQRRLLEERLDIHHLHAVAGLSMGAMQAFEWGVAHPGFMDRLVAIAGSPRATSQDLLLWTTELHAIEGDAAYHDGNYVGHPPLRAAVDVLELSLFTPSYRVAHTSAAELAGTLTRQENAASLDWNDRRRQVEAMLGHDVSRRWGSLEAAAARVHAKSLILVAEQDHVVNPAPARAFGVAIGATVEVSQSDCGHLAVQVCETAAAGAKVAEFLSR